MKYLIVYGSNQGQTAWIAERVARMLEDQGHDVNLVDGRDVPASVVPDEYAGVIVGGSVNAGKFQRSILDFVTTHRDQLRRVPSAFVAVSLAEAYPDAKRRERATEQVDRFIEESGWRPDKVLSVAGAIPHSRLSWVMRRIFYRSLDDGTRTEIADHEYTDWEAVTRFVNEFAAEVRQRSTGVPVA
jgi:menaquinone-dependent protoporphyrinogen oxidase